MPVVLESATLPGDDAEGFSSVDFALDGGVKIRDGGVYLGTFRRCFYGLLQIRQ